jgi:hypothetical protein
MAAGLNLYADVCPDHGFIVQLATLLSSYVLYPPSTYAFTAECAKKSQGCLEVFMEEEQLASLTWGIG